MKSALGMAAACVLSLVNSSANASEPYDLVDAVLWQQRSLEYAALTEQTYRQATLALEDALARCDRKRSRLQGCAAVAVEQLGMTPSALSRLAPAVVLDIDETVLDNSRFQGEMQRTGDDYTSTAWTLWLG